MDKQLRNPLGSGRSPSGHKSQSENGGSEIRRYLALAAILSFSPSLHANPELMEMHCGKCHNDDKLKGDFSLSHLGGNLDEDNAFLWGECLDYVTLEEMPPPEKSELTNAERDQLVEFLTASVRSYYEQNDVPKRIHPRRLNNREFENSVSDVLMIEDVGTHQPTDNLIGDALHHGFDTHGDSLGFSRFHLEQYIESVRMIVDATILSGEQPESRRYEIRGDEIRRRRLNQGSISANSKQPGFPSLAAGAFDIQDPLISGYLPSFEQAPETGRYTITIKVAGKDRLVYQTEDTGHYEGDPIRLSVHLGDRVQTFALPDEEMVELELDEWISAGSRLELRNPTDGLRLNGNGGFRFQLSIAARHLETHNPELYAKRVSEVLKSDVTGSRRRNVNDGRNWVAYWEGPRPRVFSVVIEGPLYESWPPKRQLALVGENPTVENAEAILRPIAERAWRRSLRDGELDSVVELVEAKAESLGDLEAIKEGIVRILVSPSFLILNSEDRTASERFASKFSYFLQSTLPEEGIRQSVRNEGLASFAEVRDVVQVLVAENKVEPFLEMFPYSWLELSDINFMAPDPERFEFYHRKRLSEDMVNEVRHFFRHVVENNLPVPELISADYSFINADLAEVYQATGVPQDSKFRKYAFKDGRRGGFLGMGAFLTSTADSLSTSPIHRGVYVMEKLMGIHPKPPPPDIQIEEPDVRQAKTIKEILKAHTEDATCASCHVSIDPYGYAFENFDSTGAWREAYVVTVPPELIEGEEAIPEKRWPKSSIPVDSSAQFRNGTEYQDITEYRNYIIGGARRDRFVRSFITKLLTYANGVEPGARDFAEIDKILTKSAENDYRIVDTISAVIDSPLFREE